MASTSVLAACLIVAAQTYEVPVNVLIGILKVEGGKVGQQVGPNRNGTYDLGPMQINTVWVPELAQRWQVAHGTAHRWLRDDVCVNVNVGAWILRQQVNRAGNLRDGIARYHSATPGIGDRYASRVVNTMRRYRLLDPPRPTGAYPRVTPQLADNSR